MTFTELKALAASYMHRTDLTDKWASFIAVAEAQMFRDLDLKETEASVSLTSVSNYLTLPNDFGKVSRLVYTSNGQEINLDYIARPDNYVGTTPIGYSQENNKLRIFPAVADADYTLYYFVNLEPLSDTVATNWLSLNAADLYLYATCLEAAKWTRDGDQITLLSQLVQPLVESVRSFSKRRALPNSAGLQVKIKQPLV